MICDRKGSGSERRGRFGVHNVELIIRGMRRSKNGCARGDVFDGIDLLTLFVENAAGRAIVRELENSSDILEKSGKRGWAEKHFGGLFREVAVFHADEVGGPAFRIRRGKRVGRGHVI
jgi:hypothetical protein